MEGAGGGGMRLRGEGSGVEHLGVAFGVWGKCRR